MKTVVLNLKRLLSNSLLQQILLFLVVGAICYVISMVILVFLVEIGKVEVNLANFFASLIAIYAAYALNARYIFQRGKHAFSKEITMFILFSLIGLLINVILMYFMVKYLPIFYVISKTLVTIFVAAFNFGTRKFFVFAG